MSHELVEGTSKLFSSNFAYHKLRRLFESCRLDGFMSMTVLYICLFVWVTLRTHLHCLSTNLQICLFMCAL